MVGGLIAWLAWIEWLLAGWPWLGLGTGLDNLRETNSVQILQWCCGTTNQLDSFFFYNLFAAIRIPKKVSSYSGWLVGWLAAWPAFWQAGCLARLTGWAGWLEENLQAG